MKQMIRFVLPIFITLTFTSVLPAQKAMLLIPKNAVDIGTIEEGKTVHVNFEVTNTSNEQYKIYSVSSTCGCTIAKYPDVIGPGKKINIAATFNSKGFHGQVKKELVLVTNDPLKYYKMEFEGKVVKPNNHKNH